MAAIDFFSEDIAFSVPAPRKISRWLKDVIALEKGALVHLNFIFCSDQHLLQINRQYLDHDTYTDIITFDNGDGPPAVEGDVFISIERVRENAARLQVPLEDELHRVIVHGVLHLLGYSDKSTHQKTLMRKKEDAYLSLRKF